MSYFPTGKHTYANVAPVTTGNVALTGLTYTTATGGGNWATNITVDPYYQKQPKVKITDRDIEIDGLSLKDTLKTMHERMAIMVPNPALEKEFADLKECADRYRELETRYLEQKKIWETLKKA